MHLRDHRLTNQLWGIQNFSSSFADSVLIRIIWDLFLQNRTNSRFWPLYKFAMTFDLHKAIILYNSKTKHQDTGNYIFLESLWRGEQFDTIFEEIGACSNFWPAWKFQGQCGHLGNTTICGISVKCWVFTLYQTSHLWQLTNTAQ